MEELQKLEQSKKYLFHGSAKSSINQLEPRQPMSFMKPDGVPAVCASDVVEPPIFMAVLGSRRLGGWGLQNAEGFGFYISKSDWERAHEEKWKGYVYVLNRRGFNHYSGREWRSPHPVKPIQAVEVGINDLPSNIKVVSDNEYMSIVRGQKRS